MQQQASSDCGEHYQQGPGKFQDQSLVPDPALVQCVIIGKLAPFTSHEATTFRSAGKPVIYIEDLKSIENWIKKSPFKLLISPQQGLAINYQGDENSLDEILANDNLALFGWVSYPIAPLLSLSGDFAPDASGVKESLQYFEAIKLTETQLSIKSIEQVLNLIAETDDINKAEQALKVLLDHIKTSIEMSTKDLQLTHGKKKTIAALRVHSLYAAWDVVYNLKYKRGDLHYGNRLFAVKILSNIFSQHPKPGEIVDGISYMGLVHSELKGAQAITREFESHKLNNLSIALMRMRDLAYDSELKQNWQNFVLSFNELKDDELKKQFENLMHTAYSINMLPMWLATSFDTGFHRLGTDAKELARALIDEFTRQNIFLSQLLEKYKKSQSININAFADPKKFNAQWKVFKKNVLDYFLQPSFEIELRSANNFVKLASASILTAFVNDNFDLCIKALSGSTLYGTQRKLQAERFATMLKSYSDLLRSIGGNIYELEWILKGEHGEGDFKQSGADIIAWSMAHIPGFAIDRLFKPRTLEDLFQIIHQKLLMQLNDITLSSGIEAVKIPIVLKEITADFDAYKVSEDISSAYLVGINIAPEFFELIYNKPLRNHSAQFVLRYYKNTAEVLFIGRYFGEARKRWEQIEALVRLFQFSSKDTTMRLQHLERTKDAIKFELVVGGNNIPGIISALYAFGNELTFGDIHRWNLDHKKLLAILSLYKGEPSEKKLDIYLRNSVMTSLLRGTHGPEFFWMDLYTGLLRTYSEVRDTLSHIAKLLIKEDSPYIREILNDYIERVLVNTERHRPALYNFFKRQTAGEHKTTYQATGLAVLGALVRVNYTPAFDFTAHFAQEVIQSQKDNALKTIALEAMTFLAQKKYKDLDANVVRFAVQQLGSESEMEVQAAAHFLQALRSYQPEIVLTALEHIRITNLNIVRLVDVLINILKDPPSEDKRLTWNKISLIVKNISEKLLHSSDIAEQKLAYEFLSQLAYILLWTYGLTLPDDLADYLLRSGIYGLKSTDDFIKKAGFKLLKDLVENKALKKESLNSVLEAARGAVDDKDPTVTEDARYLIDLLNK